MSLTHFRLRWFEVLLAVLICSPGFAFAQAPRIGDVQILPVIDASLQVAGAGKETKRTTYSPPPGWYIRSHRVICVDRYGITSFAVSTVPDAWAWSTEGQVKELHERLADVAARAENVAAQLRVNLKRDDSVYDLLRSHAGKHAIILETSAVGVGPLRGGSAIHVRIEAEMIFLGIDRSTVPYATLGRPTAMETPVRQAGAK